MEGSLRCCHVYRILPALQLPSQKIGRLAAERGIQDLNRVDYWRLLMLAREGRLQLENAARIAGGHDVGPKLRNEFGFATAEGFGGIGLNEIVDSCGAATNGGLGDFSELKARNARQQSARLREHALRMLQMAGIVERHAQLQRMARAARLELGENFADVLALCGKSSGAFGVFPVVAE